jgi:hypothetical protein
MTAARKSVTLKISKLRLVVWWRFDFVHVKWLRVGLSRYRGGALPEGRCAGLAGLIDGWHKECP